MWFSRDNKHSQPSSYLRRSTSYVDREFQVKYTRYILSVALIAAAVFMIPLLVLSNQNYGIFLKLADLMSPDISKYINKEHLQLNVVFAVTLISYGIFWAIFGKKMTAKIAGPTKVLRNHMKRISQGDFTLETIRIREDDEFKELINTYNYLYSLLKVQNERDLDTLRTLLTTVTNPVAQELINNMIEERELKTTLQNNQPRRDKPIFLSGEEPAASRGSRHAS